jgi:hypothetical protein
MFSRNVGYLPTSQYIVTTQKTDLDIFTELKTLNLGEDGGGLVEGSVIQYSH